VGSKHRPPLSLRKYSRYSLPLEAESTPKLYCGRIYLSVKYFSYAMRNRTHDIQACSEVPEPITPPRVPVLIRMMSN
jgi:hypothetical protein